CSSDLLVIFAEPVGVWILGEAGRADVIRLSVITVVFSSLVAIVLSSFRTREQPVAFALLNFVQFGLGMLLNVALVVWFRMGVHGVLWGNLLAAVAALPLGLYMARRDLVMRFEERLVRPLLHFGVLVIPSAITGWVITMADRYVLRFYGSLEEVAVYGVGYKIGMIMQMGLVWPFQLAWPAVAYSIAKRQGHRRTFSRVLTYLSFFMMVGILGLSLMSHAGLDDFAGPSYARSYEVVPLVALAYSFAGVQFCLSPGVHIAGKTQYLTLFSVVGAILNLGLNFLLVPEHGMIGATWATAISYAFLALTTAFLAQKVYWLPIERSRLLRIVAGGAAVFAIGWWIEIFPGLVASLTWQLFLAIAVFPALMLATGFLRPGERRFIASWYARLTPWVESPPREPWLGDGEDPDPDDGGGPGVVQGRGDGTGREAEADPAEPSRGEPGGGHEP
ncbi:MAG: polysaccharide biosynthesis C-terminal domain-containing protein, partial [Holophagales bacterium]|nr:polysaccharide biosynthesis C-terminal domain-containing protein [Holophagales bacterium]